MRKTNRQMILPLIAAFLSICGASEAWAQGSKEAQRWPGTPNALLVVEVDQLLQSPMGQKLDWQSKLMKGDADRPLAVSAATKRLTIAAAVNPGGMDAIWQAAVLELPNAPTFDRILRLQGGYFDRIGDRAAARTSHDVFYIDLGNNKLGVLQPAQRQFATKWVSGSGNGSPTRYLQEAQASAPKSGLLLAVDLDDVVSPTAVRYAVDMGRIPSLDKLAESRERLISALASVKGFRLTAQVTEQINADIVIDFAESVDGLGTSAGAFVRDVLAIADLDAPMIEQWKFRTDGKRILGTGTMAPTAISEIVMLLSPGYMADTPVAETAAATPDKAPPAPAPQAASDPKMDAAQASVKYFKSISSILDNLSTKASPTESAKWMISKARFIEQLPILNVDPALVEWGSSVTDSMNRAAAELGIGQQKAIQAAKGVATATPSQVTDYYGNTRAADTPESRAAYRNAEQQRYIAAQSQRTNAAARAIEILNPVLTSRGKIRADMVQKYGVEF